MRINLLAKAEECARIIEATDDPVKREALKHLQELWATLANQTQFSVDNDSLDAEIANVLRIHNVVMAMIHRKE